MAPVIKQIDMKALESRLRMAKPQPTFVYDCRSPDAISKQMVRSGRGYEQVFHKHYFAILLHARPQALAHHYGADLDNFTKKMNEEKVMVMPGYTGKPIYLCSESLTAKKTYGTSQWPFTCNNGTNYEYKEGLCPRAEETLKQIACIPLDESWSVAKVESVAAAIRKSLAAKINGGPAGRKNRTASPVALRVAEPEKTTRIGIVGCGQISRKIEI